MTLNPGAEVGAAAT